VPTSIETLLPINITYYGYTDGLNVIAANIITILRIIIIIVYDALRIKIFLSTHNNILTRKRNIVAAMI